MCMQWAACLEILLLFTRHFCCGKSCSATAQLVDDLLESHDPQDGADDPHGHIVAAARVGQRFITAEAMAATDEIGHAVKTADPKKKWKCFLLCMQRKGILLPLNVRLRIVTATFASSWEEIASWKPVMCWHQMVETRSGVISSWHEVGVSLSLPPVSTAAKFATLPSSKFLELIKRFQPGAWHCYKKNSHDMAEMWGDSDGRDVGVEYHDVRCHEQPTCTSVLNSCFMGRLCEEFPTAKMYSFVPGTSPWNWDMSTAKYDGKGIWMDTDVQ